MAFKKRIIAVFPISRKVAEFITDMQALMLALTTAPGNTYVTISPTVVTAIDNHLDTLIENEAKAATRAEGTAATRDVSLAAVVNDANMLKAEVQLAADASANEETARQIIQGCGMRVKSTSPRVKPDFEARMDKNTSLLVQLISKAADKKLKASYEWQWSKDGISFTQIKITTQSRTTWLSTFAAGTKLYFRKRVITNKDTTPPSWSQTVALIIT